MKKILFACVLLLCLVQSVGNSYSQEVCEDTASLVAAFDNDLGFAKYVDWDLATTAMQSLDAEAMTDAALQLAEAEKILLRNHPQIHSDQLFYIAFRYAVRENNEEVLARLQKAADKYGLSELKTQLALSGTSRGGQDRNESLKNLTPEDRLAVDVVLQDMERAFASGEESALNDIGQWIEETKPGGETGTAVLLRHLSTAREELQSLSPREKAGLAMLAGGSRPTYRFVVINRASYPVDVVIMWINPAKTSVASSGEGMVSAYTPAESICKGWYTIEPMDSREIFSGSQHQIFAHFSNGVTPHNYYRRMQYPVKYGTRFEVQRMPVTSQDASFRTGGFGDDYATDNITSIEEAIEEDGWQLVDFYEIDTGRFTIND